MEDEPIRVFIDASVLFAACFSATGASREILRYALRNQVTAIISELVLEETERNLADKAPQSLSPFQQFRDAVPFELVEPSREQVLQMQPYTAFKDAAVIAAAHAANVYCLVSLDRRHMIERRDEIEKHVGLKILLPSELLEILRRPSMN